MTDPVTADNVYLKPLTPESIEEILKKHRIDAVLPTMGGQTALLFEPEGHSWIVAVRESLHEDQANGLHGMFGSDHKVIETWWMP